ncbi:RNA transcription, translation and transport factor protein [Neocloeon triangulifer]|uniref:RNA transcription, translation and transport factor protein n=1 Tax=Neocloeon triangulifer TaxID=2078957 RepID=UPI00286F0382|nr:RNA transcription, translation and transport factor protein [Neocloeon triangulifer]
MFKRKLKALEFQSESPFDCEDDNQFRNLVLWLEEQKIRHYKIEDRDLLRKTESPDWNKGFEKYRNDLGCPISSNKRKEEVDWLLSYAVRLEYTDEVGRYKDVKKEAASTPPSTPLEWIDVQSDDFKAGVFRLAKMLNVTPHPDHLVTLKAISKLVVTRLNPEAIAKPETVVITGVEFPLEEADSGLEESGDPSVRHAIRVLRLLYLQDLRQLQTNVNETIVALQGITADPRTDTAIGRVGI